MLCFIHALWHCWENAPLHLQRLTIFAIYALTLIWMSHGQGIKFGWERHSGNVELRILFRQHKVCFTLICISFTFITICIRLNFHWDAIWHFYLSVRWTLLIRHFWPNKLFVLIIYWKHIKIKLFELDAILLGTFQAMNQRLSFKILQIWSYSEFFIHINSFYCVSMCWLIKSRKTQRAFALIKTFREKITNF